MRATDAYPDDEPEPRGLPRRRMADPVAGKGMVDRESVGQAVPIGVVAPGGVALLASSINRTALWLYRRWRGSRG